MPTLQQIRNNTRILISQQDSDNTDYTDAELNGLINQGLIFFAVQTKWPRDLVSIQVENDKDTYTLPSDNLIIVDAYFGDTQINSDVKPLTILSPQILKEKVPGWLDSSSDSKGRPQYLTLIDRRSVLINPRPDDTNSVSGKKLHLYYIYYPQRMTADGDEPDLPLAYHDHLSMYAAHLCYMGKLKNIEVGKAMLNDVMGKIKLLEPPVTKETEEQYFSFGSYDQELNVGDMGGGIDP